MTIQDEDIEMAWEDILNSDKYHLMLLDIQDNYPDKKSMFVDYCDIESHSMDLASFILESADKAISLGIKVIRSLLPDVWDPTHDINLRIKGLPRDAKIEVREIRAKHLGRLVAIEGMVRKATAPKPRVTRALFKCEKCDAEIWVPQTGMVQKEPIMCPNAGCNKSAVRFKLEERRSTYIDTQRIEIQENPEGLRGGAQPERLFGYVEDDISGSVAPGNRVTLNGILRSVHKHHMDKSTIFEVYMDVMSVEFEQADFSEVEITDEDEERILEMAKDPDLCENIIKSIAPTIFGLENEKLAVALQLFGGSHKVMDDGTTLRGDIHILMIGDPGVAKSQILRYMSSLSPRGIYASGKSASAAGLCVHGDTVINLEGQSVTISKYVETLMDKPEEYRPGIWRQAVSGDKVLSQGDLGSMRLLPITYVWKIKTPEKLIRITTMTQDSLTLTPETKIQAMHDGNYDWVPAGEIVVGDMVPVVKNNMRMFMVQSVEVLTEDLPEYVYDLTVDPSHSFIGSGFVVHNTAAAVKDDFGDGRWTLEAGALVLADKGLACIDELDKMSDQDRASLHEAMESQKISVAKAGITATLQCRCSLLAAANPKLSRFDDTMKIVEQINLPASLMSRFDLMFVLRDVPDAKRDNDITKHILKAQRRGQARNHSDSLEGVDLEKIHADTQVMKPVYDVDILRKYVAYSKKNCFPVMSDEAVEIIRKDYLTIRTMGDDGSVPITARQLEAYVRLSEASAKMHLRNVVQAEDAQRAVNLIGYYLGKIARSGSGFDIDMAGGETSHKEKQAIHKIKEIVEKYSSTGGVSLEDLVEETGWTQSTVRTHLQMLIDLAEIFVDKYGKYIVV